MGPNLWANIDEVAAVILFGIGFTTLLLHKNMIKKMFETGKADYYILKHIIIYLIHNIDLEKYTNPSAIKKEYNELAELSKDLSKRKAKRFIYKFQNNLLNEESCKALNKIYWEEAYKLIDNYKNIFRLKYFESRAGVNLIDFEDYKQEAVYTVYKTLKKYNIIDINDNTKYDAEFLLSAILYRLKEKMFNNRETVETEENKRTIVKYSTDISNLNLSAYLNNEEQEQEQVEIDFDTNTGINKLFSILNERSIFIIKKYTGYDGQTLTFKEIGEKLGITESITARIYKRAIQQLRQHFPPDKEQELRQLIFKT